MFSVCCVECYEPALSFWLTFIPASIRALTRGRSPFLHAKWRRVSPRPFLLWRLLKEMFTPSRRHAVLLNNQYMNGTTNQGTQTENNQMCVYPLQWRHSYTYTWMRWCFDTLCCTTCAMQFPRVWLQWLCLPLARSWFVAFGFPFVLACPVNVRACFTLHSYLTFHTLFILADI